MLPTNPPTEPDVKVSLIRFLGAARFHTARLTPDGKSTRITICTKSPCNPYVGMTCSSTPVVSTRARLLARWQLLRSGSLRPSAFTDDRSETLRFDLSGVKRLLQLDSAAAAGHKKMPTA